MGNNALIEELEKEQLKKDISEFNVGDTIRVSTRIIEREKERIQAFQGTVIAKKGSGLSETFSLHRISHGEGMERVFCLHSPRIAKIEVVKKGDVRRAKLYYLRGTTGKKAKVQEKIGTGTKKKERDTKVEKVKSENEVITSENASEETTQE